MNDNIKTEFRALEQKLGFYCARAVSYPVLPPEHVYFSLTNRCNLRCKMCDIPRTAARIEDELPTSKVKDIVLQIKNMGIEHLILSGGEPLLRNDILEVAESAVSCGIRMVDIISNGMLFDDDIIEPLIKLPLNHITISLDGLEDTNDQIRGKGVFRKSEDCINKLSYYKSKYNSFLPTVGINFTIMNKNIDDILPMIEFARTKGCNIIVFQPVLFSNTRMYEKRKNSLWPSDENISRLKQVIEKVIALKEKEDGINIYTDRAILEGLADYFKGKRPGNNFKCYEGIKRIVISYDGKLWSCMGTYGDLKKNPLKDIWLSKQAELIRRKVKRCRDHCLQDCVYFSSDIIGQVKNFLKKLDSIDEEEKSRIKKDLFKAIEDYINTGAARDRKSSLRLFEGLGLKKELSKLYTIRDYLRSLD